MPEHIHNWQVSCTGCDARPNVADHYVTFDEDGWFIEHSLTCRMAGEMAKGCRYQKAVNEIADPDDADLWGRWRITDVDDMGLPSLERVVEE